MTNYIPVELLKSPNAVSVLSMIDIVSHIIPQEDPAGFISNINRKRMTRYDIEMLERNLNTVDTFDIQYPLYKRSPIPLSGESFNKLSLKYT